MEEEKELSRFQRIEEKMDMILQQKPKKSFKIPRKARLSKKKLKEGYVTVMVLNENKNIDFKREPIEGNTVRLKDTWHAAENDDLFFFKGKPFIIQPKHRKNPYNPFKEKNETYGQKHIMARMKNDIIKVKKKMRGVIIWVLLAAGVIYFITQSL